MLQPLPIITGTIQRVTPTDISQFVRLEQCERFLRLKLAERAGHKFMESYGVTVQRVTPIMSLSGNRFEGEIEKELKARFPTIHYAELAKHYHGRHADNADLLIQVQTLGKGESLILFQSRLHVPINGWELRGDVDLLLLRRDNAEKLDVLVTDMKSTFQAKVEHRLQVAFYQIMIESLFQEAKVEAQVRTSLLFRKPIELEPQDQESVHELMQVAFDTFGIDEVLLEIVHDPEAYKQSARDLLLGERSVARRVGSSALEELPYCLTHKCDGCLFNEFCMKHSAENEDLSLLPFMSGTDKKVLSSNGIATIEKLAQLKEYDPENKFDLKAAMEHEPLVRKLSATWPIGPRLDELIHRAKNFRRFKKKDGSHALPFIPDKGNSSLPVCRKELNPNLVWLYLDAQFDPLEGRIYMLGGTINACKDGQPVVQRTIVELTNEPPSSMKIERELFIRWTRCLVETIVELAQTEKNEGSITAPIHIVFFDRGEQKRLLEGLARNFPPILQHMPPLYDFLTQKAAYDNTLCSYLAEEVRTFQNYPMTCQSLQSLAAFLKFDWKQPIDFRTLFKERMFDYLGKLSDDVSGEWYTKRARFGSSISPEYAYAAWNKLPPQDEKADEFAGFRTVTSAHLIAFEERRLEAMAHIAGKIRGNPNTGKTPFILPDLVNFEDKARDMAHALDEFVHIERMVGLSQWKTIRHAQPEQRALMGETLIVRYLEEDQDADIADQNRDNAIRQVKSNQFREANPGKRRTKEQMAEMNWSPEGMTIRLRIETDGIDCTLDEMLLMCNLREGSPILWFPRWTVDERLPEAERQLFTPTPKQLLYAPRAEFQRFSTIETDSETGKVQSAVAEIVLQKGYGSQYTVPFVFGCIDRTLTHNESYTLDPCPDEWYSYWCSVVVRELCKAQPNVLYQRLVQSTLSKDHSGNTGQARFFAGLHAFGKAGLLHTFEPANEELISQHATTPILMVQGPPGTGKSYTTAFAILARIQGAMHENRPLRSIVSCKTHAATDVLIRNVVETQKKLQQFQKQNPDLFVEFFDPRLLSVPLYRIAPKDDVPMGVIPCPKERARGEPHIIDRVQEESWTVSAATPGGVYRMVKVKWPKQLLGQTIVDLLVLDEASQMNLPEALMAALPLKEDAQVMIVGDHRQMPPIIKHEWESETRRTFRQYQVYRSLFDCLRMNTNAPPMIRFAESFRLHRSMAEFLRAEIYEQDGIAYHSGKDDLLPLHPSSDDFVRAVLDPNFPLVVIVHDESQSQLRNDFEQELIAPILAALVRVDGHALDPVDGLGIVVPHRAQRAALQQAFTHLNAIDPTTGLPGRSAIDTVERFQGGERTVIIVSATESDPSYLLNSAGFLLDPRRLTVAVSRAKQKMILVASKTIFELFSPDEEVFVNAQIWKNLLGRSCVHPLWEGKKKDKAVTVWGTSSKINPA